MTKTIPTSDLEVCLLKQPLACAVLNLLQWEWPIYHLEDGNFEDILIEYPCLNIQVIPLFYCLHQICEGFFIPCSRNWLSGNEESNFVSAVADMSILCSVTGGIL